MPRCVPSQEPGMAETSGLVNGSGVCGCQGAVWEARRQNTNIFRMNLQTVSEDSNGCVSHHQFFRTVWFFFPSLSTCVWVEMPFRDFAERHTAASACNRMQWFGDIVHNMAFTVWFLVRSMKYLLFWERTLQWLPQSLFSLTQVWTSTQNNFKIKPLILKV